MSKMSGLIRRDLLIYFKDKAAILFSMLTPIIILVLYLLFLRSNYVDSITNAASAIRDFVSDADIEGFTSGLLLCGIMGTAMITVPYNTLTTLVRDRETKVDYDLSATPIKRYQIVLSYYIASAISAFIMTSVVMTLGLLLITHENDMYLEVMDVIRLYGIVLLGSVSATAIFMPMLILFKNTSAVGAFMGIISAACGFIIGAYIPLSQFSESIQTFCNIFPATGITLLLKRTMLEGVLGHMDNCIGGLDNGLFVESIRDVFSFNGFMFGKTITTEQTVIYICVVTVVFLAAIAAAYGKLYKRK